MIKFNPYKATRDKSLNINRGTGRLKIFRTRANRKFRHKSRHFLLQGIFEIGPVGADYWD